MRFSEKNLDDLWKLSAYKQCPNEADGIYYRELREVRSLACIALMRQQSLRRGVVEALRE